MSAIDTVMSRASMPLRFALPGQLIAGGAAGLLLVLLPFQTGIVVLALATLALASMITPLAPLSALLVLAPLRALIATEAPGQMPVDFGLLGFTAVIGAWLLLRLTRQRRLLPLPVSPVLFALLPFIVTAGLSSYAAQSMNAWLVEWLKWAQMAVLIAICLDVVRARAWQWLVFALVTAGMVNAVIGIYQYFGGSGALHLLIDNHFYRAFGSFGQPNPFGGFMGLMLPLALAAALGFGWRWWRKIGTLRRQHGALVIMIYYLICAALLAAALLMSWSRGAWLGTVAAMIMLVFAAPRRWWTGAILVAALAVGAASLAATGLLPASVSDRVSSAFSETFSITDVRATAITGENYALIERLAHWQAAVNMATDHPWLGVGFGGYETAYADYRLIAWRFPLGHAHNYYLNVLAETGMIGVASFAATWLLILWLTWRARAHRDPQAHFMAAGLLGAWAYLAVHSLTDNLFVNNLFIHIGCMLGLLAVLYNQTWHKARIARPV